MARAPWGQMRGVATQAMPLRIFQARQQSRCRRAPTGWGPQRRWRCYSLLTYRSGYARRSRLASVPGDPSKVHLLFPDRPLARPPAVLDHSGRSFPIHWSQKRERGRVIAMSAPLASRDHQRTSLARASGFPTLNSGSRDLIRKQGTIQKEVVYVLPALLLGTLLPPSRKPSHQRGILRLLSIGLILFSIFAFVRNANINVAVAGSVTPFLRGSLRTLAAH